MLRGGHKLRIFSGLLPAFPRTMERAGIGPVARQRGRLAPVGPQQRHRISEIGVKQAVMAHHRLHPDIGGKHRALFAQHPAVGRGLFRQHQRPPGAQQREGGCLAQRDTRRDGGHRQGALLQNVEQPALHIGAQHLRIGKAREQIERRIGAAAGDPADQRQAGGPVLETGTGEHAVATLDPAGPEGCLVDHGRGVLQYICLNNWTETCVRSMIITGCRKGRTGHSASRRHRCRDWRADQCCAAGGAGP